MKYKPRKRPQTCQRHAEAPFFSCYMAPNPGERKGRKKKVWWVNSDSSLDAFAARCHHSSHTCHPAPLSIQSPPTFFFYTHYPHMETTRLLIGASAADRRTSWRLKYKTEQKRIRRKEHLLLSKKLKNNSLSPEMRRSSEVVMSWHLHFHSSTSRWASEHRHWTVSTVTSVST